MSMDIIDSTKTYKAPQIKVVETKVQSMLCGSPLGEKYTTEMDAGDDNW